MLNEHELRRTVVGEMHLRRWPRIVPACTIVQIVNVVAAEERDEEIVQLAALPVGASADDGINPRHQSGTLPADIAYGWEKHSEASSVTLFMHGLGRDIPPAALDWLLGFPGKTIRATRMFIVADDDAAEQLLPSLGFEALDLVSCNIGCTGTDKVARIWSDFRLRDDGFGCVLIAANGMSGGDLSRTAQRLQELGNYRNLALLGLPVAQQGWRVLDRVEAQLSALTSRVAQPDVTDDALLEEVSRLSMELATEATASDFRMSATEAYAQIVAERLDDLCIRPCTGYQSLADFTQRRLLPAVRTCAAHRRRSEQLAMRTAQFVSLFRTRIETRIENQNGELLASMESNADRQLRLQELVEGFSVVALTYYGISLIAHMLEGMEGLGLHFHAGLVMALLTPVVALLMWLTVHRRKKRALAAASPPPHS